MLPTMTDPNDTSWKTPSFRQKVMARIEDAVRLAGNPTSKTCTEMEKHVFTKAKTREEYLALVARLIFHVQEINSKKEKAGGQMMPGQAMPQQPMQDPINALQNLAKQPPALGSMPNVPGGMPPQQMRPQQMHPAMQQQMMQQRPQQPGVHPDGYYLHPQVNRPQNLPLNMQGYAPYLSMDPYANSQDHYMLARPHSRHLSPVHTPVQGQQDGMFMPRQQMPGQMMPGGPMPGGQMPGGPMSAGPMHGQNPQQEVILVQQQQQTQGPPPQYPSRPSSQPQMQPQPRPGTPGQSQSMPAAPGNIQGPRPDAFMMQQNQYMGGPPGMQRQFPGQMQQQPSSQPNSVGPMSQQPSPAPPGSYPMHSPAAMIRTPSPGSQIARSPAPRQTMGAPSPGSIQLNTPGNPGSVGSNIDDQAYLEKLKQLSKYIEPLRKMISKIDKDDDNCRKKDLSKLTNLLDILSDSSKRLPMSTLLKCEQVLEKLDFTRSTGPSLAVKSEQHMCQPLLDAISAHMRSPILNHTLQRTFGPAVQMLHGPPIRAPSPPAKRSKIEESDDDVDDDDDDDEQIPNVLQGEIARLEQRFRVNLDPAFHTESKCVHLICRLEDKKLPSVPPINITVPSDYPSSSPQCDTGEENYACTPFLTNVYKTLTHRLNRMPAKYSVTALLDTWELSVRQACAPGL
ncbi:mediator of RNA polymerase II transcription subunit 15-like isoform X2 [Tubulanus polymorphus]|uniref:mediator of RNA polymerase II transcription subunit 15-like isoform X2 n=1 Tax=Tubulanus polymorphus TaxID=672921 RepID=UPI003DA4E153